MSDKQDSRSHAYSHQVVTFTAAVRAAVPGASGCLTDGVATRG